MEFRTHVHSSRTVQRDYDHGSAVNDVVVHPNQGELISCDQNGSVKIWDLGENSCTHELVPAEDVPIRSVSIASDGGTLVAGNNKVRMGNCEQALRVASCDVFSESLIRSMKFTGKRLRMENRARE